MKSVNPPIPHPLSLYVSLSSLSPPFLSFFSCWNYITTAIIFSTWFAQVHYAFECSLFVFWFLPYPLVANTRVGVLGKLYWLAQISWPHAWEGLGGSPRAARESFMRRALTGYIHTYIATASIGARHSLISLGVSSLILAIGVSLYFSGSHYSVYMEMCRTIVSLSVVILFKLYITGVGCALPTILYH